MAFGMPIDTTGNHSLLPETTPFGGRELGSQVLEGCPFYLPTGNPPTVQVELISRYMNCLEPNASESTSRLHHFIARRRLRGPGAPNTGLGAQLRSVSMSQFTDE